MSRGWLCQRRSGGVACGTRNLPRARKCFTCGKPRPKRRRPAHLKALDLPYEEYVRSIAACESGGRWHISTGNGFYGGMQWLPSTWWSLGGSGMPHHASKLEQMYRAVLAYNRRGNWGDWPVCGLR